MVSGFPNMTPTFQTRLKSDVGISHVAVDLGFWNECCNRVHDDDVYRTGTDHRLGDLKCLLAVVRL